MTPAGIIAEARKIINDADVVVPRYVDAVLLVYVNDWHKQLAKLAPWLFHQSEDLAMVSGVETQEVSRTLTLGVADVLRNSSGQRIRKVGMQEIEDHMRMPTASNAVGPEMWCPVEGDMWRFRVWPVPTAAINLTVVVATQDQKTLVAYGQDIRDKPALPHPIFNAIQTITLTANSAHQEVSRTTTLGLVDVALNAGNKNVRRASQAQMDDLLRDESTSPPVMWCPAVNDPWRFMVWPRPLNVSPIKVITVLNPADAALGDTLRATDDYRASGANYVAARALMANTSTADVGRANGLLQLSASLASLPAGPLGATSAN